MLESMRRARSGERVVKVKLTAHWESLPFQFLINKLHGDHDCGDQDDNQPKDKFHFHRRSQAKCGGNEPIAWRGSIKNLRLCAKKFGICCPFETDVCGLQCTRPNASKMTSRCCNKGRKILVCGKTLPHWSAMSSNPCRSQSGRHAFAWLRASFAGLAYRLNIR